ncbi:MAG: DUF1499 domain-containing protein [Gemmatimonadales bacterium]
MSGQSQSGAQDSDRPAPVDTRASAGPEGRTYAVPFAAVWDAVAHEVGGRRGWELVHADEERGLFTVVCRSRLRRSADDLSIWVRLDEYGLTRLDVRAGTRQGRHSPGANERRIDDLLRAVDAALGPGTRVLRG